MEITVALLRAGLDIKSQNQSHFNQSEYKKNLQQVNETVVVLMTIKKILEFKHKFTCIKDKLREQRREKNGLDLWYDRTLP